MTHRTDTQTDLDRMACYGALALAFSYPGPSLFQCRPQWASEERALAAEYDRLFRAGELWLYEAEHLAQNEFQRVAMLSDIMGFYGAFGVEPDRDRPDALACELEFMHCLILKHSRIARGAVPDPAGEKADICRQAQRTFLEAHLAPAVAQIAPEVRARAQHPFYRQAADDLLAFTDAECGRLDVSPPPPGEKKRETLSDEQDSCGGPCV